MKKMIKSFLTLCFVTIVSFAFVSPSFCACDEEAIKRDITKSIDSTASMLRKSLEAYNRSVKNFEAKCGTISDEEIVVDGNTSSKYRGKPLSFNVRTLQQALAFDKSKYAYLTDMSQYEDTGIKWGEIPTDSEACEQLRLKAWTDLDLYTTYYTKAIVVFGIAGRDVNLPVSCVCPEGSNEQVCTAYTSTKMEEQQTGDKCDTFATYLSSLSSCPLCPIFQAVLNTDAKIADVAWRALSKALQGVVIVFFLVYLALETLKIVSNVGGSSLGSYLKSILILGFKVLLTYFLLSSSSYVYGYFISPVIQAGLDMGTSLISISSSQASICLVNNANVDFVATPGNVLDAGLLDGIMRTVRCYGHTATIMPAVGKGLICHGWANDGSMLPDFSMWFSGILFYLFGLIIWLVISFYLVDCTVQLGMVCGIIPVLIACWPFKLTTKYTIKGVQIIMNTFFNYIMLGIVLLLGVEIVDFATGKKSGSMDAFMEAMNNNNLIKLSEMASLDGVEILILVICCIFAFKLIGNTNALADKFSKGSGMNIASKLGGLASSAVVASAATGASIGAKFGGAVLEETGIAGKFTDAGNSVKNFFLDGASSVGKAVGLGRFQPQNQSADGAVPTVQSGAPKATTNASTESNEPEAQQNAPAPKTQEVPQGSTEKQEEQSAPAPKETNVQSSLGEDETPNTQTTKDTQNTDGVEKSVFIKNNINNEQLSMMSGDDRMLAEELAQERNELYQDKLGTSINLYGVEENYTGGSISARAADGSSYYINRGDISDEQYENIVKKLQNSSNNLNDVFRDIKNVHQAREEQKGNNQL